MYKRQETPEVDSFSIKSIPDNDAKILALKNGEVDFISGIKNVSAESYDEISQTEGFGAQIDDKALQTYYVGYNLNDTVFGDSVIRKAIASAIDKDAVADSIYGGLHDRDVYKRQLHLLFPKGNQQSCKQSAKEDQDYPGST